MPNPSMRTLVWQVGYSLRSRKWYGGPNGIHLGRAKALETRVAIANVLPMNRWFLVFIAFFFGLPLRSPAPVIYTPGEGWRYESVEGGGNWTRTRAKDQLDVAEAAFARKDYSVAKKAAKRTVTRWPFSDYAPDAQYLMARCYDP